MRADGQSMLPVGARPQHGGLHVVGRACEGTLIKTSNLMLTEKGL